MLARLQKAMKDKDQGFTLIELLVVIVIIGILAAIAIPMFLSQREKGADASLKSDLRNAATALETKTVENTTWTAASGATVVSVAAEFNQGADNTIVFGEAGGASGYCLKGSAAGASADFFYDSTTGVVSTTTCVGP